MAKVANCNISTINPLTLASELSYGIEALMTLLLANGWTLVSCGTGTAGVRRTTPALSQAEWIAATNTWQIVQRGTVYVVMRRVSATSMDVRYAFTAGALVAGNATTPDTFPAGTETTYNSISVSTTTRAHAVTFDSDDNAAGIRSFSLLFTDGTNTGRAVALLEAMANGTYATSNPAPFVVSAATAGSSFPLVYNANSWSYWYSPTGAWTTGNIATIPAQSGGGIFLFAGNTTPVGVDPWTSKDPVYPAMFGRRGDVAAGGLLGLSKNVKLAGVFRGYPNTVDSATDAYVYIGVCLLPFANNTVPL